MPEQLRRRRAASEACRRLECGRRDPWYYPPADELVSERELESWRCAWSHLRRAGFEPIVPVRILAAAGRRGGDLS